MLFEYTDRTFPIIAVTRDDSEPQQVDVEMKVLAYWDEDDRIEPGLGYWVKGSEEQGFVYTPTHLVSGRALCDKPFASEHMTRVFLEAIAAHADWHLATPRDIIAAHGGRYVQNLIDSALRSALETIDILNAEQVVLCVVRGLRNRTDVEELRDQLELVGDLLASLRLGEQKDQGIVVSQGKQ